MLGDLVRLLLDAVAPRRCAGCDAISRDPICPECTAQLAAMPAPRPRPTAFGAAFAGFEFEGLVRRIVHRGKYGSDPAALRAIATLTSRRIGARSDGLPVPDAIVAVPLGPRRRRQRGYNQAEIIARVLAGARIVPVLDGTRSAPVPDGARIPPVLDGLRRTRETTPQSVRDQPGRRRNVAGAFAWKGSSLAGARLWLVDDVLTTGATVEAAGAALHAAGAAHIDVVIVAEVP